MKSFSFRALVLSLVICLGQMANAALTEAPEWFVSGQNLECNRAIEAGAKEFLAQPETSHIYALTSRELAEGDKVLLMRLWEKPGQRFQMRETDAEFLAIVKIVRADDPNEDGGEYAELVKLRMRGDSLCKKAGVVSGKPVTDLELGGGVERTGRGGW